MGVASYPWDQLTRHLRKGHVGNAVVAVVVGGTVVEDHMVDVVQGFVS